MQDVNNKEKWGGEEFHGNSVLSIQFSVNLNPTTTKKKKWCFYKLNIIHFKWFTLKVHTPSLFKCYQIGASPLTPATPDILESGDSGLISLKYNFCLLWLWKRSTCLSVLGRGDGGGGKEHRFSCSSYKL